jgi:hypothetical protein
MSNRHERRKAKQRVRWSDIRISEVYSRFDIVVEGKRGQVIMISADASGRKAVEDVWPDVEWAFDSRYPHPDGWLFTHIRVTKLPAYLEEAVPLAFANLDSLAYAVALALAHSDQRIAWWSGPTAEEAMRPGSSAAEEMTLNCFPDPPRPREPRELLYAEYVPAGTVIGAPQLVQ